MLGTMINIEWDEKSYSIKSTMALLEAVEASMGCTVFGLAIRLEKFSKTMDLELLPVKEMTKMLHTVLEQAGADIEVESVYNVMLSEQGYLQAGALIEALTPTMATPAKKKKVAKRAKKKTSR